MLDADADASAAAASAAAAAGTLANAVKKTGEASQNIAGDIAVAGTLSGGVVTGTQVTVPTPVNNTDAANKKYVDDYHDVTKLNITDVNSYAVGLTGNQAPIAGSKFFSNVIAGTCAMGWSESSGTRPSGTYQLMLKIPKTAITQAPTRGHFYVAVGIRGGASGVDIIDVSTNSRTITGVAMALPRGMTSNFTYVVSDDNDYWYVMRVNTGNSLDGVVAEIIFTMAIGFDSSQFATIDDSERAMAAVPGTEKGRVNNA